MPGNTPLWVHYCVGIVFFLLPCKFVNISEIVVTKTNDIFQIHGVRVTQKIAIYCHFYQQYPHWSGQGERVKV